MESEFKIHKVSLFGVFFTASMLLLVIYYHFFQLIIFYYTHLSHYGITTISEGNRIEYIDRTTGKHCVEYTDNNSGEDCSEFK